MFDKLYIDRIDIFTTTTTKKKEMGVNIFEIIVYSLRQKIVFVIFKLPPFLNF